jgi:hypothetical protein
MEGLHVIGISSDLDLLQQTAHEVRDVRGRFDYEVHFSKDAAELWSKSTCAAKEYGSVDSIVFLASDELSAAPEWTRDPGMPARRWAHLQEVLPSVGLMDIRLVQGETKRMQDALVDVSLFPSEYAPANTPGLTAETVNTLLSTQPANAFLEVAIEFDHDRINVLAARNESQPEEIGPRTVVLASEYTALTNVYILNTNRGRGLFASRDFEKDELVMRTHGKVLDFQTEHSIQIGWGRHVEPDPPIRLINHSCNPNLGVKTNEMGLPDFVARRAISEDEEFTFDYAMTEFTHDRREDPELEFDLTCRCGSSRCRQRLGYYSELPDHLKEEYAGYISDYLLQSHQPKKAAADGTASDPTPGPKAMR